MDAILIFLGLVGLITSIGLFLILGSSPTEQTTTAKKIEGTDFIPSQMYMGNDGLGGVAVNERTRQICLFSSPTSSPQLFPLADLLGSCLIKNGEILGEGKRSHPQQAVTFYTELHGQIEALKNNLYIESIQGSNQRIDLFLMVYDLEEPIHVVNFLNMETKEGGILFEKALSTATHWQHVIDGLILEADHLTGLQSEKTEEKEMAGATP